MSQICFINVEIKKREFVSRIDLAIELVKRGVNVILGECYDLSILEKLGSKNSYILGKCAQPETLSKFNPLFKKGWEFGALDEEGLLPDSLKSFADQRFSLEVAKTCKDFFFFGQKQKEAFDKIFGFRNSFIVSGNPRTDMWQANCYGLHNQTTQDIKKKYGNFFLLPLNFGYYTEEAFRNDKAYSKILAEKSEFLFDSFCKLAEKFARQQKCNVIMRPHPTDDPKAIRRLMNKHGVKSNLVHCINSHDVFPWISAARALFHNCCTTSLEAGFCGTQVVTYAPSNISLLNEDEVNKLFPIAKTYEEVLVLLSQYEKFDKNESNFKSKVEDWGYLSQEYSGHTSSFIAEKITQRNNFQATNHKERLIKQVDTLRLKNEIVGTLLSFFGKNHRKVILDKFPRTSLDEVHNIVDNICKYREYKERPLVRSINSHLFNLSPK